MPSIPQKVHLLEDTPSEGNPLEGTPPRKRYTPWKEPPSADIWWWPPKRVVRIVLKCFLVLIDFDENL